MLVELILYLLLLAAAFTFIQVMFAFLLLYLENAHDTKLHSSMPRKPSIESLIKVFCFEWAMRLPLKIFSYPYMFFYANNKKHSPKGKTCIVLMHGYGRTELDWIWFEKSLKQASEFDIV